MKWFIFFLVQAAGCTLAVQYNQEFAQFKSTYGKVYRSVGEEENRFKIFSENMEKIREHNEKKSTYTMGMNMWTDLTDEEWSNQFLGYKRVSTLHPAVHKESRDVKDLPASVDWREKGVISDVKNQGSCGSCWAVCATEQMESYVALQSEVLLELSSQQVTSCAPNPLTCGGTGGCQGSTPPLAYNYAQLFGLVLEEEYPYISGSTSETEDCEYNLSNLSPVASITGYNNLPPNSMEAVIQHIAEVGPLAISVAANTFKNYNGGVFDGCSYEDNIALNHAVQLVGYGTDEDLGDYWIVRNSWGLGWGENGYQDKANPSYLLG
ncbi:zingipain-2 isoform X2 [Eurytemora carolleeae]|uniref:zingipain-2 isoform X2 n=1 Tax=Eurytemora carolleeae TaxID=1294199 RepID=UPI000C78A639|nr:zingipain-2 isoform X2 [Eurytemora carolleeae]|eukprot:XP_023332087.1 zingipain-2-like isoform X2 [Eurytemora affinis]